MATFDELKSRYMVSGAGTGSFGSGGTTVSTFTNCNVTPLIKGSAYFPALKAAINAVSGDGAFIYLTGWWLDRVYSLDGPAATATLADLLIAKARAGVDVRVLGWVVAPELMQSRLLRNALAQAPARIGQVRRMLEINEFTMNFILALRAEPLLANKAVLNILAHPAGAVHMKFVLLGNNSTATGFTGGLDLEGHDPLPNRWAPWWHDVQAQVEGPVLQAFFEAFQTQWNEIQGRTPARLTALTVTIDSHTTSMPTLPARTISSASSARLHVQSLRTLPQYKFTLTARTMLATNQALSYAPNGLFEIKAAWQKGVTAATEYIYMEDQGFSSQEVFDWVNMAIKASATLRVVIVGGKADPNDAPDPNDLGTKVFAIAVNRNLLAGLTAAQVDQIALFRHRSSLVHTKSTIVDDQWSILGSANAMRRSLYTDFEHSVAFMDEAGAAVATYRRELWRVHLGQTFADAAAGLAAWFAIPYLGTPAAAANTTIPLDRVRLPLSTVTLTAAEQVIYDEATDADSRQDWGGGLWSLFTSSAGAAGSMSP